MTSNGIRKHFITLYWVAVSNLLKVSPWIVTGIAVVISWLIILVVESSQETKLFFGLSKGTWLGVSGSLLAASLFWILHWFISLLQESKEFLHKDYFSQIHNCFGLKTILDQRGGTTALDIYRKSLMTAKRRIWAIGMTNQSFSRQHKNVVINALEKSQEMDIRVVYWNPKTTVNIEGQTSAFSLQELQHRLELGVSSGTNWDTRISKQIEDFIRDIPQQEDGNGQFRVYQVSLVTNMTCFIIDDEVFFFPFLSRGNSNQDPTFQVSADASLGQMIIQHYDKILRDKFFTTKVYENIAGRDTSNE